MRLFRRNRRLTWLVLCALAAQLLISFGHVHNHAGVHAEAAHAGTCNPSTQSQCPSDHDEDEQHCAICWAISLAGTALLPQPPSIDRPITLAKVFARGPCVVAYCGSETVKFQARAPPSAHMIV